MEKQLAIVVDKVLETPQAVAGRCAVSFHFTPPDPREQAVRGSLYAVIQVSSTTALFDAVGSVEKVWKRLRESYYAERGGPPLTALEEAVSEARRLLVELVNSSRATVSGGVVDFNLVALSLWGQVIYLAQLGEGNIFLRHEGKTSLIARGEAVDEIVTASGVLRQGDVVYLATSGVDDPEMTSDSTGGEALLRLSVDLKVVPAEEETIQMIASDDQVAPLVRFGRRIRSGLLAAVGKWQRRRDIYVPKPEPISLDRRPSAVVRILIGVLVVALVLSTLLTIRKRRQTVRTEAVLAALTLAESNLESAANLLDLNNLRAREILQESRTSLEAVAGYGIEEEAVSQSLAGIDALLDSVNKVWRVTPDLVYGFSNQDDRAAPAEVALTGGFLFVADPQISAIFRVAISDGETGVERVGGAIGQPRWLASADGDLYALGSAGVFELSLDDSSVADLSLELPSSPAEMTGLASYLGNLYLMSKGSSQIYKFSATNSGYSRPISWIKDSVDLSEAVSFTIDGNIFVLRADGSVLKFASGSQEDFSFRNLDVALRSPVDIFTDGDSRFLYILDGGNRRVVVADKEGRYRAQYVVSDDLGELKAFVADEATKKGFLLVGTSVYSFDLNHE